MPFTAGQTAEVVTVPGGPQISAAMVGFDDKAATLKMSLDGERQGAGRARRPQNCEAAGR